MLTIKTWKDPYDAGFEIINRRKITLEEGLTVLTGCNGYGKTTLLMNIEEFCKENHIPVFLYDDTKDGRHNALDSATFQGNYGLLFNLITSSEGETMKISFGNTVAKVRDFIQNGDERQKVILLDAIDSGMSIDAIVEMKSLFNLMMKDAKCAGVELYIIISANGYELARKSKCFDVMKGEYIEFKDYEDYRRFIITTRNRKERRYKS